MCAGKNNVNLTYGPLRVTGRKNILHFGLQTELKESNGFFVLPQFNPDTMQMAIVVKCSQIRRKLYFFSGSWFVKTEPWAVRKNKTDAKTCQCIWVIILYLSSLLITCHLGGFTIFGAKSLTSSPRSVIIKNQHSYG